MADFKKGDILKSKSNGVLIKYIKKNERYPAFFHGIVVDPGDSTEDFIREASTLWNLENFELIKPKEEEENKNG
jgi:hypothetical protein